MTPAKGQVMFRLRGGDTVEIVSQLLQGTFPNYEQLIPQSYTTRAVMDLPTVLRAAKTASIFARDGSNIIRMHLMPAADDTESPKVEISARSEEVGDNQDLVDLDEIEGEEARSPSTAATYWTFWGYWRRAKSLWRPPHPPAPASSNPSAPMTTYTWSCRCLFSGDKLFVLSTWFKHGSHVCASP